MVILELIPASPTFKPNLNHQQIIRYLMNFIPSFLVLLQNPTSPPF
jgi:hypothetical protein